MWACSMQMTNLVHAAAHLELLQIHEHKNKVRTNSCAYARGLHGL